MAYHEDIDLECRNLSGWTPLQEALLYVHTFIFRETFPCQLTYSKLATEKDNCHLGVDWPNLQKF